MVDGKIKFEIQNEIAVVTLHRARKKNTFDESMFTALEQVTDDLQHNLPRVIIITGDGDETFCAGFDVNPENPLVASYLEVLENHDIESARKLVKRIRKAFD